LSEEEKGIDQTASGRLQPTLDLLAVNAYADLYGVWRVRDEVASFLGRPP